MTTTPSTGLMTAAKTNAPATTDQTKTDEPKKATVDYESFLKLLTAQLRNQDPLAPMDATQFMTQLAQLSTVEQSMRSNDTLGKVLDTLKSSGMRMDMALLGRKVEVASDQLSLTGGNAQATVAFTAPASNGGAPITSYTVTSSPGGLTGTGAASPITVDVATDLKRAYDLRPDFQAAKLGIVRRKASSAQANNQLLPTVNFVGVYGYNGLDGDFATARRQVRGEDARAYSAGVEVSIPITFAEGRGRARAAKLALRQSEADLSRLQTDIAVDITSAAGQLETTRKRVETNRTALELARQSLDAEQKKITAGTGSTFLVLQAQGILVQVERNYVAALADERRARASYEREIGATLQLRQIKLE